MRLKKISKETQMMALGTGTGLVLPYVLKKYVDPNYPLPMQGVTWSWLIPLTTGPLSLMLLYLGKIKKANTKSFLKAYGISTTIAGAISLIDTYIILRARGARFSTCPSCNTKGLPARAKSAVKYPYLYAPQTDIWSVKAAGYGTGRPYVPQTGFSQKTILA